MTENIGLTAALNRGLKEAQGSRNHPHSLAGLSRSSLQSDLRDAVSAFGRDDSFCAVCFLGANDKLAKFGWVIRGDKVIFADKVDVVSYIECDGTSNRGGITRMTLSTGEIFEAHFEAVSTSLMSWIHGIACMDTLCKVRWGDRHGVGQFESTANIQHGTRHPTCFDGGAGPNGWYPALK